MKKTLVIILSLLICLGSITMSVSAEYTEGYFKYEMTDNSITIVSYFGSEGEVVIPDHIAGLPVTKIESGAFNGNKSMIAVTIPDTVSSIDNNMFADLHQLKKVVLQSESVSVNVPDGCVLVEDYPVYVSIDSSPDNPESEPVTDSEQNPVVTEKTESVTENQTAENPEAGNQPIDNTQNKTETTAQDNAFEAAGDDVETVINIQEKPGIITDDNKLITVDDTGNLIEIDSDGNVEVIDRNQKYTVSTDTNGKVIITDENKNEVVYNKDENTVVYHSPDGKVITRNSLKTDSTEKNTEKTDNTTTEIDNSIQKETAEKQSVSKIVIPVSAVLVIAAGGIVFYFFRKKHRNS